MTDSHPVFVVGAPRTGTTLVKNVLNGHPDVHLFDEVHFFERVWDDREQLGDLSSPVSRMAVVRRLRDIVERFGSDEDVLETLSLAEYERRVARTKGRYRDVLRILLEEGARRHGARIWGDSSPQDILYLDEILEWYPDARIIVLVRDPREFLCSYKNYHRRGVKSYRERYNPLSSSMLWRTYMTALFEAEEKPWARSICRVRYEELVEDPEGTVTRMCEHVGVSFHPAMLDVGSSNSSFVRTEEADRTRGIVASSRGRWRTELTPTELWIGEKIFARERERLGYPPPGSDDAPALRPSAAELIGIAASMPLRLFNLLFRSQKPFTMAKLRRVLDLLRGRGAPPPRQGAGDGGR